MAKNYSIPLEIPLSKVTSLKFYFIFLLSIQAVYCCLDYTRPLVDSVVLGDSLTWALML